MAEIQDIRIPINDFASEVESDADVDTLEVTHMATISIFELNADGDRKPIAYMKMSDEDGDWMEVPPHMAAQLPMAMNMMKAQSA